MDPIKVIKRFLAQFQRPAPSSVGHVIEAPNVASIHDGVDYGLPAFLPEWMQKLPTETRKAYLAESVAQTYRFQFDTPARSGTDSQVIMPTEDPLKEWDWQTRKYVLTNCHAAYQRNPLCNRGLKYFARFSIGEGFNLTCKNKEVEAVLQEFIDHPDNDIRCYERQAPIDLLVDGEIIGRWFGGDSAESFPPAFALQRPWELEFIKTEKGFYKRPVSYHFQRELSEGDSPTGGTQTEREEVAADQILHVAINRHGYELRGRPEIYGILPWLRAYKEWLENRARQNHWRGALLWFVQVKSAIANAVSSVAARWAKPPTPGSVAIESENVTVTALTNTTGGSDAIEDGREIKRMALVGMGTPEYMVSDGYTSNLATSTAQQLPALTTFADMQDVLVEQLWYPMLKRVVQMAIDAGVLPEEVEEQNADGDPVREEPEPEEIMPKPAPQPEPAMNGLKEAFPPKADAQEPPVNGAKPPAVVVPEVPEGKIKMIKTIDAFDVAYAPVVEREPFTLAQALQIYKNQGMLSTQTATEEAGFDYAIEQKRIKSEQASDMRDRASGLKPPLPGTTPPMFAGADEDAEGEQDAVPTKAA